jgi:hypothetical protein
VWHPNEAQTLQTKTNSVEKIKILAIAEMVKSPHAPPVRNSTMLFRSIVLLFLVIFTATIAITQKSLAYSPVDPLPLSSIENIPVAESLSSATLEPTAFPELTATPDQLIAQGSTNYAGQALSANEQNRLESFLRSKNISTASPFNPPGNPRFILHDTAVILPPARLEKERFEGRGPLGLGVSIYAPRASSAVVARPNFYELRRPTTTEFEKASDILNQSRREDLFRRIWRSTNANGRRQGLDRALSNLNLQPDEIAKEQKKAVDQLEKNTKIFTTGTWTAETICNIYAGGDKSIALSSDLDTACSAARNYFNTRNQRVNNSVPIEILQVGAKSSQGNQNSCTASNGNLIPFSNPPYTQLQYDNVVIQYLRAAFLAGKFPETTTHYALDHGLPDGHCDPRCFNVNKMYKSVSMVLGHPVGSRYGMNPSYGKSSGTNNIWWDNRFCHSAPPQ